MAQLLTDEEVFGPAEPALLSDEDVFGGPPPAQIGVPEALARSIPAGAQRLAQTAVETVAGLPLTALDALAHVTLGTDPGAVGGDFLRREILDPNRRQRQFFAPAEGQEFTPAGQVAFDLGQALTEAGLGVAASPASLGRGVGEQVARGVAGTMPLAIEAGQERFASAREAGASPDESAASAFLTTLGTAGANALPASAPGRVLTRALTGGAANAAAGEVTNEAANLPLPEQAQQHLTPQDLTTQAGVGALVAALLGQRAPAPPRAPNTEPELPPFLEPQPQLSAPEARPVLPAPRRAPVDFEVAPDGTAYPATAPRRELPTPQPSEVMAVDEAGVARPMSLSEVFAGEQARQRATDTGLTPDIVRVQQRAQEAAREAAPRGSVPPGRPVDAGRETGAPGVVEAPVRPAGATGVAPVGRPDAAGFTPAARAEPTADRGAYRSYERTVVDREAQALLDDAAKNSIAMTPEQAHVLAARRKPEPDRVTGMWRSEARNDIANEAADFTRRTQKPATRVSFDIQNVGGLNSAGGAVEVDAKVLRRITDITREEAKAAGAEGFEITRHGGDEYAVDLFGVAQDVGDAVGARIAARIDDEINWRLATKEGQPVALLDNPKDRFGPSGTGVYFKAMQYDPALTGVEIADQVDTLIDVEKKLRRGQQDVRPEDLGFIAIPEERVVPAEARASVLAERAERKSVERAGAEPGAAGTARAGDPDRADSEGSAGVAGEPVAAAADAGEGGAGRSVGVAPARLPRSGPGGQQGGAFDPKVFGLDKLGEAIRSAHKTVLGDQFSAEQREEWRQFASDIRAALGGAKSSERLSRRSLVVDLWRNVLASTDGNLRALVKNYNSPTLQGLADRFHATAGEGGGVSRTFDEAVSGEAFARLNKASEISALLRDNKLLSADAQARIVRLVENPKLPRNGAEGKAAAQVEAYFREMHGYLKEAGVDVDEVTGYFPRQFDTGEVVARPAEFLAKAKAAYMAGGSDAATATEQANALFTAVLYGDSGVPGATRGSNPAPSFVKSRVFSRDAAKILDDAKFYSRDIEQTLVNYTSRAVKRAEIARRFGDNWNRWGELEKQILSEDPAAVQILDQVRELAAVSAGVQQGSANTRLQQFSSGLRTWTTLGLLDQAALASMGELLLAPLRATKGDLKDFGQIAGNLTAHLKNSARLLTGQGRDKDLQSAFNFAQDLGIIAGEGQASLMAARFMGGDPVGRIQGKALSKFFQRNLLEQLTNYTRVQTLTNGQVFVRRLASDLLAGEKKNAFFLRELGVPAGKEKAFADWVAKQTAATIRPASLAGEFGQMYTTAMRRFVDQTVMRPSNSTRPAWANTPLGGVVFQLQSFGYAFQKNVLNRQARLGREAVRNEDFSKLDLMAMSTAATTTLTALVGMQYLIAEGRDEVFGAKDRREMTPQAKIERAVSRAGGFGVADPAIQTIGGVRYDRSVAASLMGPGVSSAVNAADVAAKALVNNTERTNTQERAAARALYDFGVEPLVNLALTPAKVSLMTTAITLAGTRLGREAFVDAVGGEKDTKASAKPITGVFEDEPTAPRKRDKPKAHWRER